MRVDQTISHYLNCEYDRFCIYVDGVQVIDCYACEVAERCPDYVWNLEVVSTTVSGGNKVIIEATAKKKEEEKTVFTLRDILSVIKKDNLVYIFNGKGSYITEFKPEPALVYLSEEVLNTAVKEIKGAERNSINIYLEGKEKE